MASGLHKQPLKQWVIALLTGFILCGNSYGSDVHVAIIIDDLGHNLKRGEAFINLAEPITFAVLPHTSYAKSIATAAHRANKEVMVHLPMANLANTPIGPGGLTANLPRVDFMTALDAAIAGVPFASGINNHTGSYLTQQTQQMGWLMGDMKERGFFFIDSRTTAKSVALKVAEQHHVIASSRDIFLGCCGLIILYVGYGLRKIKSTFVNSPSGNHARDTTQDTSAGL